MLWHSAIGAGGVGGSEPIEVVETFSQLLAASGTPSISLSGRDIQADDVIVTALSIGISTGNRNISCTSSGFIETHDAYANDTYDANMACYYKVANGTETSIVFNQGGTSFNTVCSVVVVRNVDTSSPTDGYAAPNIIVNGGAVATPSITTSNDNSLLVLFGCAQGTSSFDNDPIPFTSPSGAITFSEEVFGGVSHAAAAATIFAPTAGVNNPPDFGGGTKKNTQSAIAVTIALRQG